MKVGNSCYSFSHAVGNLLNKLHTKWSPNWIESHVLEEVNDSIMYTPLGCDVVSIELIVSCTSKKVSAEC